MMNKFFCSYDEILNAFNELLIEAAQNFIKINMQYRESFNANENVHAIHSLHQTFSESK